MAKPGLQRAIPMGIFGWILGMLIVLALRWLQQMDPLWDAGVALVLAPWTATFFAIWGIGGFNPKMSEHAHGPHEAEHHAGETALATVDDAADEHEEDEEAKPMGILMSQMWGVITLTVLVVFGLAAFAALPTGLTLITTENPNASRVDIGYDEMELFGQTFEVSQLTQLVILIAVIVVSLVVIGGALGLMFTFLNGGVNDVKGREPTPEEVRPPFVVRAVGNFFGAIARGLRRGLPTFLGQR